MDREGSGLPMTPFIYSRLFPFRKFLYRHNKIKAQEDFRALAQKLLFTSLVGF